MLWLSLGIVAAVVLLPIMGCLWLLAHLCRGAGIEPEELGGYVDI
jgi:hypothetical protein